MKLTSKSFFQTSSISYNIFKKNLIYIINRVVSNVHCTFCKGNFDTEDDLLQHKIAVHYASNDFDLRKMSHPHKDGQFNSGTYEKVFQPDEHILSVSDVFTPEVVKQLNHLIDKIASKTGIVSIKPSLNCLVATVDGEEEFTNHRQDEIYSNQGSSLKWYFVNDIKKYIIFSF